MSLVFKIFWRLDHATNFTFLDQRGSALKVFSETLPGHWSELGEGSLADSYVAARRRAGFLANMSFEVHSLNGSLEWSAPVDIDSIFAGDEFRAQNKILDAVIKFSNLIKFKRVGIRFIATDTFDEQSKIDLMFGRISQNHQENFNKALGGVEDIGFVFEGSTSDRIKYRLQYGPLKRKNLALLMDASMIASGIGVEETTNSFFDLDLYEVGISLPASNFARWASTKFELASGAIRLISRG